jgi:hypothetical protein
LSSESAKRANVSAPQRCAAVPPRTNASRASSGGGTAVSGAEASQHARAWSAKPMLRSTNSAD